MRGGYIPTAGFVPNKNHCGIFLGFFAFYAPPIKIPYFCGTDYCTTNPNHGPNYNRMHILGSKFSSLTRFLAIFALSAVVWNGSAMAQSIAQVDSARNGMAIHTAAPAESGASGEANLVLP